MHQFAAFIFAISATQMNIPRPNANRFKKISLECEKHYAVQPEN
jgi:hypothetical protein